MASFAMHTCIWVFAIPFILWCDLVESTVTSWGDDYFSFESDSTFHNIHDSYYCYLHYDPDDDNFCSSPTLNFLGNDLYYYGCVAVLFSRGACDVNTQVFYANALLDAQRAHQDSRGYPMDAGILLISGTAADGDTIRPASAEDYDTDFDVVTVTYDAGLRLQDYAVDSDDPYVDIDGYPVAEPYQDPPVEPYQGPPVEPYQEERLGVLPIVIMACLLFGAIVLCLYYIRKCFTEEDMCIFRGNPSAVPRVPGAAATEEPKKVLTEAQVNELLNANLDSKKENDTEGEVDDETDGDKETDDEDDNKADFGVSKEFSTRPCAICIEDCDSDAFTGSLIMTLPCKHKFHVDCIVPWLTQRKAQCPLCNDDLSKRVSRQPHSQAKRSAPPPTTSNGARPSSATSGPANTFSLSHVTW